MHKLQQLLDRWAAGAGKRQRVSPQDDAFHFFNRDNIDRDPPHRDPPRKPHLEEAAMALLLLDVHSAPAKVGDPGTSSCLLCSCHLHKQGRWYSQDALQSHQGDRCRRGRPLPMPLRRGTSAVPSRRVHWLNAAPDCWQHGANTRWATGTCRRGENV